MTNPGDLDTWRTANLLLKEYGAEAWFIAARRADALLAQGDMVGAVVWRRIVTAINEFERKLAAGDRPS